MTELTTVEEYPVNFENGEEQQRAKINGRFIPDEVNTVISSNAKMTVVEISAVIDGLVDHGHGRQKYWKQDPNFKLFKEYNFCLHDTKTGKDRKHIKGLQLTKRIITSKYNDPFKVKKWVFEKTHD